MDEERAFPLKTKEGFEQSDRDIPEQILKPDFNTK